ncbi:uncharacterized protein F5891DRAFT_1195355 [Suillus fuscotomentosus]|uniref:Uncharacterized protein n=1 Tax=Suillus fuscotomentosus TaxID=1912939 RepID=A0AAD4HFK6_9AGAM|nr:uncharacterized protein F5891DRAFT_1195355 [Suillus fuscotomentosus]KAG1894371.1 hypothetical protein F5891DRAFT_1195355 [Suillus fuscotomentosus]
MCLHTHRGHNILSSETFAVGFKRPLPRCSLLCLLTAMTFLNKAPSCVSCVVDKDICPPPTVHAISDYPKYYDALYYPQYHPAVFATAQTFCAWLLKSLVSHCRCCLVCRNPFTGCVPFDGVHIVVTSSDVSLSLPLGVFESAGYHHCAIMHKLSLSSNQVFSFTHTLVQYPPWMFYSEDTIKSRLDAILFATLSESISRVPGLRVVHRTKPNFVAAITHHFLDLHANLIARSMPEVLSDFASVMLPLECDHQFLPLLSAFVENIYGPEVAAVLRRPAPPTYVYHSVGDSMLPWTLLSTDLLVRHLCNIPLASLRDYVHESPLPCRPVVYRRSHPKTSNSLVCHIRAHVLYLQLVGHPVLCDIWLAYSPFTNIFPAHASELITCILEFEYGSAVVQALASDPLTLSERLKFVRREQKVLRVSAAVEQAIEQRNQWPVLVPKHTVAQKSVPMFVAFHVIAISCVETWEYD